MKNPSISIFKNIFKNKILSVSRLGIQMFKPLISSWVNGFGIYENPSIPNSKPIGFFYFIKPLKLHLNSFFLEVWMVTVWRRGVRGPCLPCLWDPKYAWAPTYVTLWTKPYEKLLWLLVYNSTISLNPCIHIGFNLKVKFGSRSV